jgi:hypothetical protein
MSEIMSWSVESRGRTRERVIDRRILEALVLLCYTAVTCRQDRPPTRVVVGGAPVSAAATAVDTETIKGPHHFSEGYPTENDDGSINAVIEIPAGTTGKFEVDDNNPALDVLRPRQARGWQVIGFARVANHRRDG